MGLSSPRVSGETGVMSSLDRRLEEPGDDILVRIRGLIFSHGARVIFDGVDLDIRRGSVTAVMGPSGTGKTTLLKLISGQLRPDAGTVEVDGEPVHTLRQAALFQLRRRMGMLFQSGALLTDLNVFDNVAYPLREHTDLARPWCASWCCSSWRRSACAVPGT